MTHQKIVFFDGVCNLCNGFVDFIVREDRHKALHLASLQGATAEKLIPMASRRDLGTVIYFRRGHFYYRSDAVGQILCDLSPPLSWLGQILLCIPTGFRDGLYNWVARHRYGIFGKRESCRVPTAEEREQFIP